ncbi:MAG: type II toxin-antitoxin system PemK/MazF family toxin [Terracidiphilus sp.]|jgi:mRNA interferase MazF
MRRGDLYRVHQPPGDPKKYRSFAIASRQSEIDSRFSTVICAPIFTNGQGAATQVSIGIDEGMKHDCWIWCDGLTSIPKSALTQYVGSLSRRKLTEFNRALAFAIDLA